MTLFHKAELGHSHLKSGILGLAGAGKTMTSTLIAIGLTGYIKELGVQTKNVTAFVDTENGAAWLLPRFKDAGIELQVARTRSLTDLRDSIKWATDNADVLIIDSITHFWRLFCEEYAQKKNRKRGLEFSDWDAVKREWRINFTDLYLNSPLHIVMCGRQGYEYDMQVNDAGKKELIKTAVKMKAEGETGFEPSLLIQMEQEQKIKDGSVTGIDNVATVLKDRADVMNGAIIRNPTFESFLPHIKRLSIGGAGVAIDTTRDSGSLFTEDGEEKWSHERRLREIYCEEIKGLMVKHGLDGTSADVKKRRMEIVQGIFGTMSWTAVENMKAERIKDGFEQMKAMLEPPTPANGGMDSDENLDARMAN